MHMPETKENFQQNFQQNLTRPKRAGSMLEGRKSQGLISSPPSRSSFENSATRRSRFIPPHCSPYCHKPFQSERGLRALRQWAPLARLLHSRAQSLEPDGSSMQPAQAANPQEGVQQFRLTHSCPMTSRARLSTLCSYTSQEDAHSHSHLIQSPSSLLQLGFFGQSFFHMFPKSREKSQFDREAPSSAIMCKPHMTHALIVSTWKQCPKFTISLMITGFCFLRAHRKAHTSFGTLMLAVVHIPQIQKRPHPFPSKALPILSADSLHKQHLPSSWRTYVSTKRTVLQS